MVGLEIMSSTPALRNLIREGKTHQIQNVIQTNYGIGMRTMDGSLVDLFRKGIITKETLFEYAVDKESVKGLLSK